MPGEVADPRPLHQRIAADLRDEVLSGRLKPGAQLPSTARLTERFGASNATVQKALAVLKGEGLVVGRAGAAVNVREQRRHIVRPADFVAPAEQGTAFSWIARAAERGQRATSTLLDVGEVVPPEDVATAFGLSTSSRVLLRRQVLALDDEPAEMVTSYYPMEIARGTVLMDRRRIRGGTPTLLAELGHPPGRCVDLVSARVPTQQEYEALRLPSELPVLRTFRVVLDDQERPIEVTVMVKASHLYELQYEFP